MSADDAIRQGRIAHEALMDDTFLPKVPSGLTVVDGLEVQGYTDGTATAGTVLETAQQAGAPATRTFRVGGVERPVIEGGLHIPVSAAVPRAGDRGIGWEYLCTAIGAATDPYWLNKRLLVVGISAKSRDTARRLDVVEVPW